jgi:hypothetical protein
METSISLFDEIKKGGYESSIITTFNAYLPFYEEVLLRKLSSNGVRHNVLMMDSAQCQRCFSNQPPYLAGRRYTLLPMQSNGVFHPKIILLLGKKKGLLAVGSHNLTLSGFGENRELTNVIRFSGDDKDDSIIIFNQVLKSLYNWVKYLDGSIPDNLIQMLHKAQSYAPWLDAKHLIPSDEISIIATEPEGNSLWSQLKTKINGPISRIVVGSAFFDSKLAFLNCLINELRPNQLYIGIDPSTVMAPPELASLKDVIVVNTSNIKSEESTESLASKYLHAKFIVIENTEGVKFLVSGSANASAPAWLGSGASQSKRSK